MCLSNEQEKARRAILKGQFKSARQNEAISKFRQTLLKRRRRIEELYPQSVANEIYIFPKTSAAYESSSESTQELPQNEEEWVQYDLKSQNKKDKNYQTQTSSMMHARCSSTGDGIGFRHDIGIRQLVRSQKKMKEDPQRQEFTRRVREEKGSNKKPKIDQVNISNYNSRKGVDKTALNSSKKLIMAEQYSIASHQARTKKGSQAVTMTCRRKQPPRSRLATENT